MIKNLVRKRLKIFLNEIIKQEKVENPENLEEQGTNLIGRPLFKAFIEGYTQKQWQTPLKELPASIIKRLPVRFTYNNRYFNDTYEGIPSDGYGKLFENMLASENITIKLNTDFFLIKNEIPKEIPVIYTGPVDRYFDYCFGELGWRTIDLEEERIDIDDHQGTSVMNYADLDVPYTRIHEYKHYQPQRKHTSGKTIIFKEFSRSAGIEDDPYYPINTPQDKEKFKKYQNLANEEKNVIFGGRLGSYAYMDMHQVISSALSDFNKNI